jgi:ABC-type glycerol-3-phosphate transport system permease component
LSFRFAPEILVILPLFLIYQKTGLYDTYFGLICLSGYCVAILKIFHRTSKRQPNWTVTVGGRCF